jgi:ParB family chromosome partitioning protein
MTATTTVLHLGLGLIRPSPLNPRKSFDEGALKELAADIERHGVKQPILVRAKTEGANTSYEIIVGERRWRASKLAKRANIPAIIEEMDDDQVREIQLVENLQRANVHPMEEAEAFGQLYNDAITHNSEGTHLELLTAVAKRVSRDVGYIAKRMKLNTLVASARKAFLERDITLGHATLLATLQAPEQEKALRWLYDPQGYQKAKTTEQLMAEVRASAKKAGRYGVREIETEASLRGHIEDEFALELKKAPWDLADKKLVIDAGACTTCTKRTGANQALFGELLNVEDSTCMDGGCFNRKKTALVQLVAAAAESKDGKRAVQISHKYSSAAPKGKPPKEGEVDKRVFRTGQWVEAKKGECDNVVTGVYVDYPENTYGDRKSTKPGSTKSVCITAGCKKHKKEFETRSHHGSSGGYDYAAEEQKRKDRQARADAEKEVRIAIVCAAVAKVKEVTHPMLVQLVLELLSRRTSVTRKQIVEAKPDTPAFAKLAAEVLGSLHLEVYGDPSFSLKEFNASIAALGSDPGQLRKQLTPKPEKKAEPAKAKKAKAAKAGK